MQESEDEEESRDDLLAVRRGGAGGKVKEMKGKGGDGEQGEKVGSVGADEEVGEDATAAAKDELNEGEKVDSDDDIDLKPKKRVKKSRAKPTSYLDELLAERSKKKKGRRKGGEDV